MTSLADHSAQARCVELILQQLDELPTLSPIAVRLLELTSSEDGKFSEVVKLIAADPSLASKVLKLCRAAHEGRARGVKTIDRAVVMLGFEAVRTAVLSVEVFELLDQSGSASGERRTDRPRFDRLAFWHHSLAVSACAELLAKFVHRRHGKIEASDAALAGLLHDLGMLALHVSLPTSWDRVCELAESHAIPLAEAARRIIGIDSHTAGKRIAEHWGLPTSVRDCIWLNGQPFEALPDVPHRGLIGLISLADAVARRQHLMPLGHVPHAENIDLMAEQLGMRPSAIEDITPKLHEQIAARAEALGMDSKPGHELLLASIGRANQSLGRINATLRKQAVAADRFRTAARALSEFHESIITDCSPLSVLRHIARSAQQVLERPVLGVLHRAAEESPWELARFADDGRLLGSTQITGPSHAHDLARGISEQGLGPAGEIIPITAAGETLAMLVLEEGDIDGPLEPNDPRLKIMIPPWAAALTAGEQVEAARHLSEQLADANRKLAETQERLAQSRALATIGEVAAGAAHEMNNPLTVISGRAQLLASQIQDNQLRSMAEQIVAQASRVTDMISALRALAEPPNPRRRTVDLAQLLTEIVAQGSPRKSERKSTIRLVVPPGMPQAFIDPDQISDAVRELVRNALEAESSTKVEVRVQLSTFDDRLMIQVTDDGKGLSDHARAHAFDPFFSEKPAGRQPGLGLSRARRLVEGHGGQLTLENVMANGRAAGAQATILLPDWRRATEPATTSLCH